MKIIEGENAYWLGSAHPKITIVEFGDFSCSACKNSFSVIREISVKYKDQVKIIFRDFPLVSEDSLDLSMAGRCAGEQGLFWPMYDKLFLNQGISTQDEIQNIFTQIGGNSEKFEDCFQAKRYYQDIQDDLKDADSLGIKGTPAWFINGNNINGDIPREMFLDLVEKILGAS
jgi:protein-disulfide isomerase